MLSSRKFIIDDATMRALINEIRLRQHLWNPEDDHYRDKNKSANAWREMAKTLAIPEQVMRIKWKNLRDIFNREVRKHKPLSLEDYKGYWKFFDCLWFLYKPDECLVYANELANDHGDDKDSYVFKMDGQEMGGGKVYADALDTFSDNVKDENDGFESEVEIPAKMRKTGDDDDYDMMFLKSLAPYFRALGPVKKLVVRNKIQEILLDELGMQNN